ncbi:MAG: glycosyltransferase [Bacteroidota bacterium]
MKMNSVSIVVPIFESNEHLSRCLTSLRRHARHAEKIIVINDTSAGSDIEQVIIRLIKGENRFQYFRNEKKIGFIRTCNKAVFELDKSSNDILLLNANTEVTKGFLEEMMYCLHEFEKNAVCSPRSNNATIMTIPPFYSDRRNNFSKVSFSCWKSLRHSFRRYEVVPTAAGFCMLIKRRMIDNFGFFDEHCECDHNADNDFCARINRYGYSSIRANRAFVYHYAEQSSGNKEKDSEKRESQALIKRYPEYKSALENYCEWGRNAIDHFSDILGECYPRKRIYYDLTRLQPVYNGANEQAIHILLEAYPILSKKCDVTIVINKYTDDFLGLSNHIPAVSYPDSLSADMHYDLAFVPHQIYEYEQLFYLNRIALRIAVNILDVILLRSNYLHDIYLENLYRHVVKWTDGILSISRSSMRDIDNYYGKEIIRRYKRSAHPVLISKADRRSDVWTDKSALIPENFILIIGNKFYHKAVSRALEEIDSSYPVIVIGDIPTKDIPGNVQVYRSGYLSNEFIESLYSRCKVLLFPSQYEGFGLPVLNAITYGKPVILFRSSVFREMYTKFDHKNAFHFIDRFSEIPPLLRSIYSSKNSSASFYPLSRTWAHVGRETAEVFEKILSQRVDPAKLEERFFELKSLEHFRIIGAPAENLNVHSVPEAISRLTAIEQSLSYRVGKVITYPLRKIYDKIAFPLLMYMGRSSSDTFRRIHLWWTKKFQGQ